MKMRVVVLMGGWSAEREVSLVTGNAVADALTKCGYEVTRIDADRNVPRLLATIDPRPDVVFNALHGRFGEDGCIQGVLEILGLPYTHSGVLASALAMHKPTAKRLFAEVGIPCPDGKVVDLSAVSGWDVMAPPYVIKPVNEGSTVGVHIIMDRGASPDLDRGEWAYGDEVLVERYIPGRELSVAVIGDKALGVIEIRPLDGFYDYEAKYSDGKATHLMPAPVVPEVYQEALRIALLAHRSLGCRGVSRADLRYDDTKGEPGCLYMLEVNTQPGMTPLSLVPEIAAHSGVGFADLVSLMVENAQCDA